MGEAMSLQLSSYEQLSDRTMRRYVAVAASVFAVQELLELLELLRSSGSYDEANDLCTSWCRLLVSLGSANRENQ